MYKLSAAVLALVAIAVPALPAKATELTTSPGKNAVAVYRDFANLDGNGQFTLSGVLAKAKAKSIVKIDATVQVQQNSTVKGVFGQVGLETPAGGVVGGSPIFDDCNNSNILETLCSVTLTQWFDIDDLEASQPGIWKNQSLTITLSGGASGAAGAGALRIYSAQFTAQFIKK